MKKTLLCFVMLLVTMMSSAGAVPAVNLTPAPARMTVGEGSMVIPADYTVAVTSGLPADMATEADRFVEALNAATGLNGTVVTGDKGTFAISADASIAAEGYTLKVTPTGASIAASTPQGLFYAFQTVKKILPANVMAGIPSAANAVYSLPVITVTDYPRYGYRGYMLDVSRHFFDVKEVKRILDIMSYYKLNVFHFHLTDDQGWRLPVEKWPRLTTVGATRTNNFFTDIDNATQFWTNAQYGPYSYTKEELLDIVAYAAERHIEVIPEVEMPGHFSAAIAAYPELACFPEANHTVQNGGGIFGDVLNIGSPRAVEFARDVLAEVMDIFPSKYIHIGGDECPDGNWRRNAECQALVEKLGYGDNFRALQSHFTNEMAAWAREHGKELIVWNESLTAGGTEVSLIREADPVVMCWTGADGAANKSIENGLRFVYTPQVPFYICRRYSDSPIPGPGYGDSDTPKVYDWGTPDNDLCMGIQGTFWCEHVATPEHLEYLTLPRLMAIAESGWTPASRKNFADFSERMTADVELLNLRGYRFHPGPKGIVLPDNGATSSDIPQTGKWYTLISRAKAANDERTGKVIELLAEGSPVIGTNNAQPGRLWMNTPAAEGDANADFQLWGFEPDPAGSGLYAMVCKARPEGSVIGTPTALNNTGRWDYDDSGKHYTFSFPEEYRGNGRVAIASTEAPGVYMNAARNGQGLAVNCYNKPDDADGGIFEFAGDESSDPSGDSFVSFVKLVEGKTYLFANAAAGYEGTAIADLGGDRVGATSDPWAATVWRVASARDNADRTQSVTLVNAATGRAIGATLPFEQGYGRGVSASSAPAEVTVSGIVPDAVIDLAIDGNSLWPLTAGSSKYPSTLTAGHSNVETGSTASRSLGAQWTASPASAVEFVCTDTKGAQLGSFTRAVAAGTAVDASLCPAIANHAVKSVTPSADGSTVSVVYERTACTVTYTGTVAATGVRLAPVTVTLPVGSSYAVDPSRQYFTVVSSSTPAGTRLTLDSDVTVNVGYSTEALMGVEELAEPVGSIVSGHVYVIKDNHSDRWAYRIASGDNVGGTRTLPAGPAAAWQLSGSGTEMSVMNTATGTYVAPLKRSTPATLQADPATFTFDYADDAWRIHIGDMYWDGVENLNLVGWNGGQGHPYLIHEFVGKPYFKVAYECVDESGTPLQSGTAIVAAGERFAIPAIAGLYVRTIEADGSLDSVASHLGVRIVYTADEASGIDGIGTDSPAARRGTFDLTGRRITGTPAPGIYIIDGVKTIVR